MKDLVNELIKPFLLEEKKEIVALYAGGFKPPTAGHLLVVEEALAKYPEIDKFIVVVGTGVRDEIDQEESLLVWEIYQNYLPMKVEIMPAKKPAIGEVYSYAKEHPEQTIYWVIGGREGREDDLNDIAVRTRAIDKAEDSYNNVEVKIITTPDSQMSGTNARKALLANDKEAFFKFLPARVKEKEEIFTILRPAVREQLKEHSMGETIDLLPYLAKLTQHMINKGYNIEPLPGLTLVDDDVSNAEDFFGKTAYYDPNERIIVLYTHGRHPKDIARSYAHEMIHHIQNLEGRLGDITTTNTQEDDYLNDLEAEANLKGTMTFRNWTDSLQEKKVKDPFGLNAFAYELARLDEGVIFENEELNTLSLYSPGEIRSMDLPKGGGIYFWWVNSEAAAVIDGLSPNAQVGMCQKRDINGEEYSLVYVGLAKNLNQRVKDWHINQKHSDSAVRSGFISTLRHTIAAVLGQNLYAQEAINDFQNNYMLVGFIETEDYKNEELKFIGSCSLPLNIRDNKNHPFYKELKALRKISKQNSKEKLNEGVYDSLTTKLTKATIQKWVADFKKNPKLKSSFIDLDIEDVDGKGRDIEFNYVGMLKFDKKVDGYVVDGTSNSGEEEDKIPFIATLFTVNPKVLPQAWSQMSADVSDVIRHEIEHLTQSGENVRSGKYMDDDIMIRDMINKLKILPKSDYYKLEKEVDAMLQGLYLKAKKTRKPFADVINNYLDIAPGIETKEDKEIILNLWRSRRKALSLPLFENEEVMNYTIYSDMDGVLSDFDKRFMQFSDGIPPGQYEQRKGKEEFWKLIDDTVGVPFWAGMDWMPDGKEYWSYIEKYNPIILSAPSKNEESKYGKRIWKKRNMPNNKMILVPAWKKKEYATPTSILIDDRADNINQWEAAGGIGILHTDAASTIAKLKELGL